MPGSSIYIGPVRMGIEAMVCIIPAATPVMRGTGIGRTIGFPVWRTMIDRRPVLSRRAVSRGPGVAGGTGIPRRSCISRRPCVTRRSRIARRTGIPWRSAVARRALVLGGRRDHRALWRWPLLRRPLLRRPLHGRTLWGRAVFGRTAGTFLGPCGEADQYSQQQTAGKAKA